MLIRYLEYRAAWFYLYENYTLKGLYLKNNFANDCKERTLRKSLDYH